MVDVHQGDYAIISLDKKKKALVKIVKAGHGFIPDKTSALKSTRQYIDFEDDQVVANLGASPIVGAAYGVRVEPLIHKIEDDLWGQILIFKNMTGDERVILKDGMSRLGRKLEKMGLFPNRKETDIIVRPPGGKWAGYYVHNTKEDKPDTICYKPTSFDSELRNYILSHEVGHAVWFTMMPEEFRKEWIKVYIKAENIKQVTPKKLKALFDDYTQSEFLLRSFIKQLDDDDTELMHDILRHIAHKHRLQPRHIDTLKVEPETIWTYWPKHPIDISQKQMLVSEYAQISPDELWAEAFAFMMIGKSIPKSLDKLMSATLAACKQD